MKPQVTNDNLFGVVELVAVYVVEVVMKVGGFGPSKYFSSGWNM